MEYKSEEMLNFFIRSLKAKIQKLENYMIEKNVINALNFNDYRKNLKRQQKYIGEEHYEDTESQVIEVRFFHNLTGDQAYL